MDCTSWFTTKWSGCSVSCGEGVQSRTVECRDSSHQLSNLCPTSSKPIATKPCSTGIHCPFSMEASEELLLPGLYHTQPLVQPYPPPPVPERLIGEQNVPTEARSVNFLVFIRFSYNKLCLYRCAALCRRQSNAFPVALEIMLPNRQECCQMSEFLSL
nr:unnamed protein product [Callosobruchus analis]